MVRIGTAIFGERDYKKISLSLFFLTPTNRCHCNRATMARCGDGSVQGSNAVALRLR